MESIRTQATSLLLAATLLFSPLLLAEPRTLSGAAEVEWRAFNTDRLDDNQSNHHPSIAFTPEFYQEWNEGDDSFTLILFGRKDREDDERTHVDIREANWLHLSDHWQLRVGIGKVFWGSVEAQHLVDVINQTDALEGLDGEDKLGQPMINLVWPTQTGELSLFWLPVSRERAFTGVHGRPRAPLPVDSDSSRYQSDQEQNHQDYALRWSFSMDQVDIALSHFSGTSREPQLQGTLSGSGQPILVPYYPLIRQSGLELTAALGDWLWKFEGIRRSGFDDTFHALALGFEYTWVGVADSDLDLGLLVEYHSDERDHEATTPFQDDFFAGLRLTFNDFQSTELLAGAIQDRQTTSRLVQLEASRRIGDNMKLAIEGRLFQNLDPTDPLYSLRNDDYIQLNLTWYF